MAACAVGLAVSETPVGVEPTPNRFAGGCRAVWLQRHVSALPRNRTPSCRFVVCRAIRYTCRAYLHSVSTRNRTWTWTFGGSYAIRYTIETFSVPTWSRTRARALGGPRAIRYTIGTNHQSRRLDLHQHDAVYKTAASLFGHVGNSSRSARSRTPCDGFGDRLLSQEHTPVSAPALRPGTCWRNNYSRSVTFQYASLMNFDQLSIRTSWSA